MRFDLKLIAFVVASSAIGCGDDIKFPEPDLPDPALNAVIPAEGFSGRTIRVQVSGDGTAFTDAATLDFGAGITATEIELASTSDLFATLTIAPDAALGAHDVKVTDGGTELTLTAAFEVVSPIEIIDQGGDPQQGGFQFLAIINHDVANPFPPDPTLIAFTAQGIGTQGFVTDNDAFTAFATVLFDTDAAPGSIEVTYNFGSTQVTSRGGPLDVGARTATPLTDAGGFTGSGTLATSTSLFSFTPATPRLVVGDVIADVGAPADALPDIIFLPGGKWANARFRNFGDDNDRFPASAQVFAVVVDFDVTGYNFDLNVNTYADLTGVVNLNEAEPNNTSAQAQQAADIGLFSADMTDPADVDFIKVSATIGQTIRVITTTGGFSGTTDTEVTIFDTDGTTVLSGPTDNDFAEDVTSLPVLATGDYFVSVNQSFFCGFLVACDRYEMAVLVEDVATVAAPKPAHPALEPTSYTTTRLLRTP